MEKNYLDYDVLCEMYEDGKISAVEFVTRQDAVMTRDYEEYCSENLLDRNDESSALAFMKYRERLFEENISN